jgi:hypothetical protein
MKKPQPKKGDKVETLTGYTGEVYSVRPSRRFGWLVRLVHHNSWEPLENIVTSANKETNSKSG